MARIERVKSNYCGHWHRIEDGVPLNHRCRILPPMYLRAEAALDPEGMIEVWCGRNGERPYPCVILHEGERDPEVEEPAPPPEAEADAPRVTLKYE